eukprot:IDg21966t1
MAQPCRAVRAGCAGSASSFRRIVCARARARYVRALLSLSLSRARARVVALPCYRTARRFYAARAKKRSACGGGARTRRVRPLCFQSRIYATEAQLNCSGGCAGIQHAHQIAAAVFVIYAHVWCTLSQRRATNVRALWLARSASLPLVPSSSYDAVPTLARPSPSAGHLRARCIPCRTRRFTTSRLAVVLSSMLPPISASDDSAASLYFISSFLQPHAHPCVRR